MSTQVRHCSSYEECFRRPQIIIPRWLAMIVVGALAVLIVYGTIKAGHWLLVKTDIPVVYVSVDTGKVVRIEKDGVVTFKGDMPIKELPFSRYETVWEK
jgi:hypothetical protein